MCCSISAMGCLTFYVPSIHRLFSKWFLGANYSAKKISSDLGRSRDLTAELELCTVTSIWKPSCLYGSMPWCSWTDSHALQGHPKTCLTRVSHQRVHDKDLELFKHINPWRPQLAQRTILYGYKDRREKCISPLTRAFLAAIAQMFAAMTEDASMTHHIETTRSTVESSVDSWKFGDLITFIKM